MKPQETIVTSEGQEHLRFQRYRLHPEGGDAHIFERREILVGSAPDADLVIDDPTVSRAHAHLAFDGVGYRLTDLESKNGTWIDGVRIERAWVGSGASLRFGRASVTFSLDEETVEVALSRDDRFGDLLGQSHRMREIFALLSRVAGSDVSVLVEGESGTGKELAAEALHLHSSRRGGPFVVFDCSAVAPDLIESELFGHVRGAFTGAVRSRAGVLEQAHGGTLFLDEIGEMPLDLQPKLLRCLEKGEYRPVGGDDRKNTDVRVIAATNRRLTEAVEAGDFRQDLYYRLAVVSVQLPPLRHRAEDIPLLVRHFLSETDRPAAEVGFETMARLQGHPWPGNVRELKNYVARAVVLSEHGRLETRHLAGPEAAPAAADAPAVDESLPFKDAKARLVEAFERRYWSRLLEASEGNVSEAARRGGIHRKSLEYLLRKLDLRAEDGR